MVLEKRWAAIDYWSPAPASAGCLWPLTFLRPLANVPQKNPQASQAYNRISFMSVKTNQNQKNNIQALLRVEPELLFSASHPPAFSPVQHRQTSVHYNHTFLHSLCYGQSHQSVWTENKGGVGCFGWTIIITIIIIMWHSVLSLPAWKHPCSAFWTLHRVREPEHSQFYSTSAKTWIHLILTRLTRPLENFNKASIHLWALCFCLLTEIILSLGGLGCVCGAAYCINILK